MHRKRIGVIAAALTAAAALLPSAGSQAAVGNGYVLDLEFNESGGATAVDSSGMNHHGAIGSHVLVNGGYADWDRHPPDEGRPYGFDHLITIPDAADGSLDPGTSNFSVEMRLRTRDKFGNVLQKGQSRTYGGQVKFQAPQGRISCMFKTPQGTATAGSGTTLINDNVWHVVRCDRTQSSVSLYIDGVRVARTNHYTGSLNNKKPWTVGGKSECDAVTVTCDYFPGDIDYIRITKG